MLGLALWLCLYESGVHATLAGVIMGLLTPAVPLLPDADAEPVVETVNANPGLTADELAQARSTSTRPFRSPSGWSDVLHPWSSYVIIPIFALVNAGVELHSDSLSSGGAGPARCRARPGRREGRRHQRRSRGSRSDGSRPLPAGVRLTQIVGVGALGGIGFTVSLFVSSLAFDEGPMRSERPRSGSSWPRSWPP